MPRKLLALIIAVLLLNLLCVVPVGAATRREDEARSAEKVKDEIARLGTGQQARIELKLRDGTKLKGYVSELDETHFVVVDAKSSVATTVAYPQVHKVKGNNLSRGVKIAIAVSAAMGALLLIGAWCNAKGCRGW
jgi:hypothetical protein